ncbi:MAG: transglycosylase domain-containing protein [Verrucomicrobiota bacterium]
MARKRKPSQPAKKTASKKKQPKSVAVEKRVITRKQSSSPSKRPSQSVNKKRNLTKVQLESLVPKKEIANQLKLILVVAIFVKCIISAWALLGELATRISYWIVDGAHHTTSIIYSLVFGIFRGPFFLKLAAIVLIVIPAGLLIIAYSVIQHYWDETSSFHLDEVKDMAYTTLVYDRNGELIQRLFDEYRLSIDDSDIPRHMRDAVIATEDQRFYAHGGVDLIAIARALIGNLQKSRIQSGASTITQQLARNTVSMFERTYDRKLKEMVIAVRIEQVYEKEEILNLYLNRIYFGRNMYGIGAAADGYFSKHPKDLTLAESALLAGIISAPNSASPWFYPERARSARQTALSRMLEQGYITHKEYQQASDSPISVQPSKKLPGSYVISAIREEMPDFLSDKEVFQGGLKIYTTIDLRLQKIAEKEVERGCLNIEKLNYYNHPKRADFKMPKQGGASQTNYLQGAFVAIKNDDGGVLSVVGGRSYDESHFNRALLARRQVGSSIKPFVYTHAFNMLNMTAFTEIDQTPFDLTIETDWPLPPELQGQGNYISVREALRLSNNYCAMRAGLAAGKEDFAFLMNQLTETEVPPFQSSFLGACEITPFNMVSAYTVFPNYGRLIEPYIIERIEDANGRVIYEHQDQRKQVLSPQVSFQVNHLMQEVVNRGTGAAIKSKFKVEGQLGGKTGTTNDYRDCWFVGFSSSITAGVWVGMDEPKEIISRGYSSRIAVPIWGRIMKAATEMYGVNDFEPPRGVRKASRGMRVIREKIVKPAGNARFLFFNLGWREKSTRVVEKIMDSPDDGQQEYIREDQAYRALARLDNFVQSPAMLAMSDEVQLQQEAMGKSFKVTEPQYDYFENEVSENQDMLLSIDEEEIEVALPVDEDTDTESLNAPRAVPVAP